jgi:hypothetical protein
MISKARIHLSAWAWNGTLEKEQDDWPVALLAQEVEWRYLSLFVWPGYYFKY